MGSFLVSGNVYRYKIKHEFFDKSNKFEPKNAMKEQTIHFIGCCHCVRLALSSLDHFHHFHVIFIHIFLRLELVLLHLVVFVISSENYPSDLIVTLSNIHYVWVKRSFIRSLLDRTERRLAKFPFDFFSAHTKHIDLAAKVEMKL